jgi:hypothetical protein
MGQISPRIKGVKPADENKKPAKSELQAGLE